MNTKLKFDGPQLEELLARVRHELGSGVTIVEANRTRRGGVGGFFAKEWFEVIVEHHAPASVEEPAEEVVEPALDPLLELAMAVDDGRPAHVSSARVDARAVHVERPGAHLLDTPAFAMALAAAQREAAGVADTTHPVRGPVPSVVPAPTTRRLRDLDLGDLLGHLDTMVPEHLIPQSTTPIVAVVGEPGSVRRVATGLAGQLGLDATDVVVASAETDPGVAPWLAVRTPDDVVARLKRWRGSGRPTVVAVELTPGLDGHAWAASMLGVLGADQVRLVAKAWQLADQLAAKGQALGGVDGLDLVEIESAAEPELFLELALPVLGIDGRPATSDLWAAVLLERRSDARNV